MGDFSKSAENYLQSAELLKSNEERKKIIGLYRNILSVISNLQQQNLSMQNILPLIRLENTDEAEILRLLAQKNNGTILNDFPDQAVVQEVNSGIAYVIFGGAKFPIYGYKELSKYSSLYRGIQKIPSGSMARIPDIPHDGTLIKESESKVYLVKDKIIRLSHK